MREPQSNTAKHNDSGSRAEYIFQSMCVTAKWLNLFGGFTLVAKVYQLHRDLNILY